MKQYNNLINFIRSTFQEPTEFIPLHDPRFIGNERKYMMECIDTNFVSSVGEFVGRFEQPKLGYMSKWASNTNCIYILVQSQNISYPDDLSGVNADAT